MEVQGELSASNPIKSHNQQASGGAVAPKVNNEGVRQPQNTSTEGTKDEQKKAAGYSRTCVVASIGALLVAIIVAVFVVVMVVTGNDDDDDSAVSGSTEFEKLLAGRCVDQQLNDAITQQIDVAYYASIDFPLASELAETCENSTGIQNAVSSVLPSSPLAVVVAVPEPSTVRITATFPTEAAASAAVTALSSSTAVSSIAGAIEVQLPGVSVDVTSVATATTGRVVFSVTRVPEASSPSPSPSSPCPSPSPSPSQGSQSMPDKVSSTLAFDPVSSTSFQNVYPVAGGKVAILGYRVRERNQFWYVYDPSMGSMEAAIAQTNFTSPEIPLNGIGPLAVVGGKVYFSGGDSVSGQELWSYDGETQEMVADLYPGNRSSDPALFTVFDDKVVMQATLPNPGARFEFPTVALYDPATGLTRHLFPAGDVNALRFYQSGTVIQSKLYFQYGNGVMVWDGTVATPVTLPGVTTSVFAAQGNRVFTRRNNGIWEINTTTNTVTEFQADSGFFRNFVIGATGQERLVVTGSITDSTGEYLMQLNLAGDAFEPIVEIDNATSGIAGRLSTGIVFNGKLYFSTDTDSDRPIYVYNGTGVPTLVGELAVFASDSRSIWESLSVTSNGLYLKPHANYSPRPPVNQDYVVIRADGSVEVVDVGDMSQSSGKVFEVHGVEYTVGTYVGRNGISSAGLIKLNAAP